MVFRAFLRRPQFLQQATVPAKVWMKAYLAFLGSVALRRLCPPRFGKMTIASYPCKVPTKMTVHMVIIPGNGEAMVDIATDMAGTVVARHTEVEAEVGLLVGEEILVGHRGEEDVTDRYFFFSPVIWSFRLVFLICSAPDSLNQYPLDKLHVTVSDLRCLSCLCLASEPPPCITQV